MDKDEKAEKRKERGKNEEEKLEIQEEDLESTEKATGVSPHKEISDIYDKSRELADTVEKSSESMKSLYDKMVEDVTDKDFEKTVTEDIRALDDSLQDMRHTYEKVYMINDELTARQKDLEHSVKKKRHEVIGPAPANATIDVEEESKYHFAHGLNLYKLILLFTIGSFAGLVTETLWRIVTAGDYGSRAGLIYGPFSPLYGVGAVAITIALYRFRNLGTWFSFFGGMIIGSIAEYICSVMLQYVFHIQSWNYSNMPFNLNGRICLLYSIFWGILGVIWIKNLYPRLAQLILKIPNMIGRIGTILLTAFLIFDIAATICCVSRWSQRDEGIAPSNSFWEFIDEEYPDSRMQKVFSNMSFIQN